MPSWRARARGCRRCRACPQRSHASCTGTCTGRVEDGMLAVARVTAFVRAARAANLPGLSSKAGTIGSMALIRPLRPRRGGAERRGQESVPLVETRLEDLVVITGFSGAGKSTAMNVFEDAGDFCVDNLPPEMIRSLVELVVHKGTKVERAAVVSDVRGGVYFEGLRAVVDDLDALGLNHHVLFLEAAEQSLVTRYKETRRRHPLAPEGSVAAGVGAERGVLKPLRRRADLVIDTTGMSAALLRGKIADEFLPRQKVGRMAVTFMSFGFQHGPPREGG